MKVISSNISSYLLDLVYSGKIKSKEDSLDTITKFISSVSQI